MPQTRRHRSWGDGDLVRICWARRESCGAAPVRSECTRSRSDERTRHRRTARDRSSEVAAREFAGFWLARIPRAGLGVAPKQRSIKRLFRHRRLTKLHDGEDTIANTRDGCAPQNDVKTLLLAR